MRMVIVIRPKIISAYVQWKICAIERIVGQQDLHVTSCASLLHKELMWYSIREFITFIDIKTENRTLMYNVSILY